MSWDNSEIPKKSLGEGPVLMVYQKPEALRKTNNSLLIWDFPVFAMNIFYKQRLLKKLFHPMA